MTRPTATAAGATNIAEVPEQAWRARQKKRSIVSRGGRQGFFGRLRARLNRGDSWLTYDLGNLFRGRKIDAAVLDELETRLLTADVGRRGDASTSSPGCRSASRARSSPTSRR